jgi:hypothetical protein
LFVHGLSRIGLHGVQDGQGQFIGQHETRFA